jgi:hypothetical protein
MKWTVARRNGLVGTLLVFAVATVVTVAKAGAKFEYPITVGGILWDPGTGVPISATEITGSVGSVRATADNKQYIGCFASFNSNSFFNTSHPTTSQCYARDASGNTYACTNTSAEFRAAVRSIDSQSNIDFIIQGGNCVYISVESGSSIKPPVP